MTHAELVKKLFENQDLKYKEFHLPLVPGVSSDSLIGVRVPVLRKLAKEFFGTAKTLGKSQTGTARTVGGSVAKFMDTLPHKYFEENHIHSMLLEHIKDFDECLARTEQFLPYIDNWAICDGKKPRALLKDVPQFLKRIQEWVKSDHPYVVRFDINMLMDLFLDDRYDPKFLKWVAAVDTAKFKSLPEGAPSEPAAVMAPNPRVAAATPAGVTLANPEYYVQMEVAWYFATALAKHWDDALPYIEKRKLDPWTHNKAIQKSIESFRVTDEHKAYLRTLKV
ncbi:MULTISPECIES: DNA alkylation repair protein [unclassified Fibrobacter]|uniref:DNA alkylation repair protein n=1 Tax=unclassified Fibrobacter TaxID=2634177 RepID=UPI000D6CB4D9|nr:MULTISPECIES: DNA alkylation repair protein [unclassified Fibrobacter]PWJ70075.1 DNA alkylation repair enzyme [Fibrobacter sp. UWR4]PZW73423.1 DNA alkylation repair enzyme [Fibrobacter sp. UWR1]